jgi:hypothetical protein
MNLQLIPDPSYCGVERRRTLFSEVVLSRRFLTPLPLPSGQDFTVTLLGIGYTVELDRHRVSPAVEDPERGIAIFSYQGTGKQFSLMGNVPIQLTRQFKLPGRTQTG